MFPVDRLERPKVLFVIPGEAEGSSMVFARRQAETLRQRSAAEVECFHLRSRTSPVILWKEAARFRAACRDFKPDIVHAHFGTVTGLFCVLFAGSIPVLITFRGSDLNVVPTERGMRAWLGRCFSQFAALGAARIFCVSRGLRQQLWWRRSCASVLPSGVDTNLFRPLDRNSSRTQLEWSPDPPVVLFNAGHDSRNKRLDLAQSAFELVLKELPDARFEILRGQAPPETMPLIMAAADCLLVTSDAEGSPTVVQEAIATNLPIVSVDVGDVRERLGGVSQTQIVDRSASEIATALVRILRSGQRSNGSERVTEICSIRIADELAQVYRELTARQFGSNKERWNTTPFSPPSRS